MLAGCHTCIGGPLLPSVIKIYQNNKLASITDWRKNREFAAVRDFDPVYVGLGSS
jgi:hypothetical protein